MYQIIFSKQAVKALRRMPRNTRDLITEKLNQLAEDPFASHLNTKKLHGRSGYRERVADWRVIYEIVGTELKIIVVKVALRSEIYR